MKLTRKKPEEDKNMKHARRIALVLALSLLILCLAGCGRMTAEKLAGKMVTATAGKVMTQMDAEMDLEMDFAVSDGEKLMEMGFDIGYEMAVKMRQEPFAGYGDIKLDVSMDLLGQNVNISSETMQLYMVLEDGKLVSYTHTDSTDSWDSQEAPDTEAATQTMDYSFLTQMIPEITLEEEKAVVGDREVYVIRLTMTGEQMQKALGENSALTDALSQAGIDGQIDFSALTVPAVFYVDAETFLPVQIELEIAGMGEMMQSMVTALPNMGLEGDSVQISVPVCRMVVKNISFDPVEVPALPEDIRK